MSEYQTHGALVATLETEIVRLRAVNAELRSSIQAPIQPDTKLVEAARQALEALAGMLAIVDDSQAVAGYHLNGELEPWGGFPEVEAARAAITALREALEAVPQPAAVEQEPVAWIANEWSVFNTGAEVASGLSLNEAMDYLTDERAAREWSVVCVINKDNMPTRAAPQPARQPLTDEQIDNMVVTASLAERDLFRRFAHAIERAHGIGGEA